MNFHSKLASIAIVASLFGACETYDPPPEITFNLPEGGAFLEGQMVEFQFSEPVAPNSVQLVLWSADRDIENNIPADAEPLVAECNLSECGEHDATLSDDEMTLRLQFNGTLGLAGPAFVVQFLPGLADQNGRPTGETSEYDIQFRIDQVANQDPVEFDNGTYIFLAQVEDPLPAVLTLIADVEVKPDGRFAMASAEGDEINGAPKNTRDPENLVVDETDQGYTIHALGFVTQDDTGKRTLETEPVSITLPSGPLNVDMTNVRLFADIEKNGDGKDILNGSLSFEKMILINPTTGAMNEQPGGSTALIAEFVPPELEPSGIPEICGDLCGAVVEGLCQVPEDFPGDFCQE